MKDFEKKLLREAEQAKSEERTYIIQSAIKTTNYLLDLIKDNRYREGSKARFLIPEHELFKFFDKDRLEFFDSNLFTTLVMMRCQNDNGLTFKRGVCATTEYDDGFVVTIKDVDCNDCTDSLYIANESVYGDYQPSDIKRCVDFLAGADTYSVRTTVTGSLGQIVPTVEVVIDSTHESMPSCLRAWLPCTDKTKVTIRANYVKPDKVIFVEDETTPEVLGERSFTEGFLCTLICLLLVTWLLFSIS